MIARARRVAAAFARNLFVAAAGALAFARGTCPHHWHPTRAGDGHVVPFWTCCHCPGQQYARAPISGRADCRRRTS